MNCFHLFTATHMFLILSSYIERYVTNKPPATVLFVFSAVHIAKVLQMRFRQNTKCPKTLCFQGFPGTCKPVNIIPTRCRILQLKQICLVNMMPAILIILTIHIIIAIRWMLIKILSAVINDWERIKVIVSGGCCLDINIIRKMDLKNKILWNF